MRNSEGGEICVFVSDLQTEMLCALHWVTKLVFLGFHCTIDKLCVIVGLRKDTRIYTSHQGTHTYIMYIYIVDEMYVCVCSFPGRDLHGKGHTHTYISYARYTSDLLGVTGHTHKYRCIYVYMRQIHLIY